MAIFKTLHFFAGHWSRSARWHGPPGRTAAGAQERAAHQRGDGHRREGSDPPGDDVTGTRSWISHVGLLVFSLASFLLSLRGHFGRAGLNSLADSIGSRANAQQG